VRQKANSSKSSSKKLMELSFSKSSFKKLFHQIPKLAFLLGQKANFGQINSFLPKSSLLNRGNIIIQPLWGLFLYHFLKGGVQPSLSFLVGLGIVIKVDSMLH